MNSSYLKHPKSHTIPDLSVGGSISGREAQGFIDLSLQAPFETGIGKHSIVAELTLEEAKAFAKTLLSEIEEVEHKVTTGKWKHELEEAKP